MTLEKKIGLGIPSDVRYLGAGCWPMFPAEISAGVSTQE